MTQLPVDGSAVASLEDDTLDDSVREGSDLVRRDDDTEREKSSVQSGDDRGASLSPDLDRGQTRAIFEELNTSVRIYRLCIFFHVLNSDSAEVITAASLVNRFRLKFFPRGGAQGEKPPLSVRSGFRSLLKPAKIA